MTYMPRSDRAATAQGALRATYLSHAGMALGGTLREVGSIAGLDAFFERHGLPPDAQMLGMHQFHQSDSPIWELAAEAAAQACAATSGEIDSVIFCSSRFPGETSDHAEGLRVMLERCGLSPVFTTGVTLDRCASFLAGIRLADAMVAGGRASRCLVVTADRFASDAERLRAFALFSDGAAACLVSDASSDTGPSYRIAGFGAACDRASISENAKISPGMMQRANAALMAATGRDASAHRVVLPTNIYMPIAMMAEAQGGAAMPAIFGKNIARRGHVFAADPLVNLIDREQESCDPLVAGDHILLGATVPGHRIAMSLERL